MKQVFLSCVLIAATTIVFGQAVTTDFQKLGWLEGTWRKTNTRAGRSGYEQWEHVSASSLKGLGIAIQGKDTVFMEKLELLVKDGCIYYVADVAENKTPTYFKITSISANSFTCENADHDFPKKIVYARADNKLKVTISGDGKSVDFLFEKG